MRANSQRCARRGDGFTLVELVVSIAVMGLIATVIASVIGVAVRNNPEVKLRTDAALSLRGVTTWLPQDVDSTPPTGFDVSPTRASGCAESLGVNVLHMSWTETISGTTTTYVADYRYVTKGTENVIRRTSCSGTGAAPLGNTVSQTLTGPLAAMPGTWAAGQLPVIVAIVNDGASGDVATVTIDLMTANNQLLRVEAAPKNPANTLPAITAEGGAGGATTVLATTTTTTVAPTTTIAPTTTVLGTTTTVVGATTTVPATTVPATTIPATTSPATTTTLPQCSVTSATLSSATMKNTDPNGNGNSATGVGVLVSPVTITAQTTGYCAGLVALASTGAPNGELFHNFSTSNGTTYTVTFPGYPQGSSELWADGNRTISFSSPTGGPYGSVTLLVK